MINIKRVKHEDGYELITFSGFNLNLGNNYTIKHLYRAMCEIPELLEAIGSVDCTDNDVFVLEYNGNYSRMCGQHRDCIAVADYPKDIERYKA